MSVEKILDVCGNGCPSYVIRCRVALEKLKIGEAVRIIASERACMSVIPSLAKRIGCEISEQGKGKDGFLFRVSKIGHALS